jgi:hypothetical protein
VTIARRFSRPAIRRLEQQRDAGVGKRRRPLQRALGVDRRVGQHEMQQPGDLRHRIEDADRDAAAERMRHDDLARRADTASSPIPTISRRGSPLTSSIAS